MGKGIIKVIDDYMNNEYDHQNKKIVNERMIKKQIRFELNRIKSDIKLDEFNNIILVKYFKKWGNVSNYYNFAQLIREEISNKQNVIYRKNPKKKGKKERRLEKEKNI